MNKKHFTTNKSIMKSGGLNLMPLIIIGLLAYVLLTVDLNSFFKSDTFKKNVSFFKSNVLVNFSKINTQIGDSFFQTQGPSNTNKSSTLNLNNFLPQINNNTGQNTNATVDQSNNQIQNNQNANMTNQRPAGYADYGSLR